MGLNENVCGHCFQHVWHFEVWFHMKIKCSLWLQNLNYDGTLFETSQTAEVVLLGGLRCSQMIVYEAGLNFYTRKSALTFFIVLSFIILLLSDEYLWAFTN